MNSILYEILEEMNVSIHDEYDLYYRECHIGELRKHTMTLNNFNSLGSLSSFGSITIQIADPQALTQLQCNLNRIKKHINKTYQQNMDHILEHPERYKQMQTITKRELQILKYLGISAEYLGALYLDDGLYIGEYLQNHTIIIDEGPEQTHINLSDPQAKSKVNNAIQRLKINMRLL